MTNDDIAQKLALLPEGLAERNLQSWNRAVEYFGGPVNVFIAEYFPYTSEMQEVALVFLNDEQAKLFRAEVLDYDDTLIIDTLIISTTDGQVKIGEPDLRVFITGGFLTAQYGVEE